MKVFGGVLGLIGGFFGELSETWQAIVALFASFALGISFAIAAMSYINLPAKAEQNRATIDSLATEVDSLGHAVSENEDQFAETARRIELLCRELLDDPGECELRFELHPNNINNASATHNLRIILQYETRQTLSEHELRQLRSSQYRVLSGVSSGTGNSGS